MSTKVMENGTINYLQSIKNILITSGFDEAIPIYWLRDIIDDLANRVDFIKRNEILTLVKLDTPNPFENALNISKIVYFSAIEGIDGKNMNIIKMPVEFSGIFPRVTFNVNVLASRVKELRGNSELYNYSNGEFHI